MKRTISHEASVAAARLRELGFAPGIGSVGGGVPDPLTLLGLGPQARWSEVRQAYVARLRVYHPEQHPQEFMRVVDAYDTLKRFFRASMFGADTATGPGEADDGSFGGGHAAKRRRADAAGASLASPAATAPNFAGLQECWQTVAAPAPVIALDPSGVGHIDRDRGTHGAAFGFGNSASSSPTALGSFVPGFGTASSSAAPRGPFAPSFGNCQSSTASGPFGSGFGNSMGDDDDDCGGLVRSVSNHMGSAGGCGGGFGGVLGAPINVFSGGQPMNGMCGGGQPGVFSNRGDNAMMIG